MTDTPPPAKPVRARDGQLVVSVLIVTVMGAVALALITAGVILALTNHTENAVWLAIGTIAGSLATALNAPTGVSNAIKAMTDANPKALGGGE